jgi:hypothetical protein
MQQQHPQQSQCYIWLLHDSAENFFTSLFELPA